MSYKKKPGTIDPNDTDPSIYYYDEVYDEMKEEENLPRGSGNKHSDNKESHVSKYTQGLLQTAELRKKEKDLRKLKRYTRDRIEAQEEGNILEEDIYITPAYKEKLEELGQLEKERQNRLEQEQNNTMNFLKKMPSKKNDPTKRRELDRDEPTTSKSVHTADQNVDCDKNMISCRPHKARPRSKHERRAYLRDVLAKRTVGQVYVEALDRYIKRKAGV